ncbi:MAG: hypothetical protein QOI61_962 [Actinomycetota bacterium]|jgi:hypothetical protein
MRRGDTAALILVMLMMVSCGDDKTGSPVNALGETTITCGNAPVSLFQEPPRKLGDSEPDRVAADDPGMIDDDLKTAAVWRTYDDGEILNYLGGDPPDLHLVSMKLVDGAWKWQGGGGCTAFVRHEGKTTANWAIPSDGIDQTASSFEVWASDRQCASGVAADERVGEAEVLETDDSVVVTFTATPLKGAQNCPGHAPTHRTVALKRPLGDRKLLDGGVYPPQEPCRQGERGGSDIRGYCNTFLGM